MNFRPKFRARPSWKPRLKFPHKGKPRSTRGTSIRKEKLLCLSHKTKAAAGLQRSSRRLKPKRDTARTIHPERSGSTHRRERLTGKAREQRRAEIFARSQGQCEEMVTVQRNVSWNNWRAYYVPVEARCPNRATQWSHARHAANKCDCYSPTAQGACSIASCDGCHDKRHNAGGKPCPKKVA